MVRKAKAKAKATPDPINDSIPFVLRRSSKCTPRFLFRAWSEGSGGNPRLNTVDAITHHAFLDRIGPSAIDDIPGDELIRLWNGHFTGGRVPSVFSSWSQSLRTAMSFRPDGWISVMDTESLAAHNSVSFTDFVRRNTRPTRLSGGPHEYLVFGVVTSDAYRTVDINQFSGYAGSSMWFRTGYGMPVRPCLHGLSLLEEPKQALAIAIQVGQLFGGSHGLAVTCQLLSWPWFKFQPKDPQTVAKLASAFNVPSDWLKNIASRNIGGGNEFPEAVEGADLMRAVARHAHGTKKLTEKVLTVVPPTYESLLVDATAMDVAVDARPPPAYDGTASTKLFSSSVPEKVPRWMKELFIDMHGWDAAAAEVTSGSMGAYRGHLAGLDTLRAMKVEEEAKMGASRAKARKSVSPLDRVRKELRIDMIGWNQDDALEDMRKLHPGEYGLLEQFAGAFAMKCEESCGAGAGLVDEDVEMVDCRTLDDL
ncbi:hypothetical protein LTR10_011849 [Elasticomyces elasticus]|nr:hypothetical protein LTR10_011849 [Elasticomyces elasticus]KAK4968794.1 hypothetical protein LTR42_009071 [Elasticomyces elasticus]